MFLLVVLAVCVSNTSSAQTQETLRRARDRSLVFAMGAGCAAGLVAAAILAKKPTMGFPVCGSLMGVIVVLKVVDVYEDRALPVSKNGIPPQGWDLIKSTYTGNLVLSIFTRDQLDSVARRYASGTLGIKDMIKELNSVANTSPVEMARLLPVREELLSEINL